MGGVRFQDLRLTLLLFLKAFSIFDRGCCMGQRPVNYGGKDMSGYVKFRLQNDILNILKAHADKVGISVAMLVRGLLIVLVRDLERKRVSKGGVG